jgi:hypothetical protein
VPVSCIAAVALYGVKGGALRGLLETAEQICSEILGDEFRPYTLYQTHSTLIRLDGTIDSETGLLVNHHYVELAGVPGAVDHRRALDILATHFVRPLRIRIGGIRPGDSMAFSSRGKTPYERMFSAQDGALVLIGWPVCTLLNEIMPRPLDDLRREMNKANILHWYHRSWADIDNDFHITIGHYNGVPRGRVDDAVRAVLTYLSQHPAEFDVGLDNVAIVASNSPTLAPAEFVGRLPIEVMDLVSLYY